MENVTTSGELATVVRRDDAFVKPEKLRSLYKTFAYVPAAADQNELGVVGLNNMYPSPKDLKAFMGAYRADAVAAAFTVDQVNNGGNNPEQPGEEANGNIQYCASIAFPTPLTFYSIGGTSMWLGPEDDNEPEAGDVWLEWLNYILKLPKIPQTINISYGSSELTIPQGYAKNLCDLFEQLGARGVSVLVASGDDGVGHGDCKLDPEDEEVYFNIQFPASCERGVLLLLASAGTDLSPYRHLFAGPYVTSVGGTTRLNSEIAAKISQGGFSYFFERPDYQEAAVTAFLQNLGDKYSGLYRRACCCDLTQPILTL
jgi:tripeptidyl-peptidase-1